MGFKKVILQLPAEGFTGQTAKHTVTATNLKNNPELEVRGVKEGDEIDIIVQAENNNENDSAATPGATVKVKPVGKGDGAKRAKEIAEKFNIELVIENTETGDFFTSENLALLSVKGDKTKLKNHNF